MVSISYQSYIVWNIQKKETTNILANIGDHQAYDGDYQPGELEEAGTFIW